MVNLLLVIVHWGLGAHTRYIIRIHKSKKLFGELNLLIMWVSPWIRGVETLPPPPYLLLFSIIWWFKLAPIFSSVEVLVPWKLWGVELWPDWVYDHIEDGLEWKLRIPEEGEWQGNWVEGHHCGHHDVGVEGQPLISNKDLFEVDQGGEPSIFLGLVVGAEDIPPGTELNSNISNWVVSRLQINWVNDIVSQNDSIGDDVHAAGNNLNDSKNEICIVDGSWVGAVVNVEGNHEGTVHDGEDWCNDWDDRGIVCVDLGISDVPGGINIMDSAFKAIFNCWGASGRPESPMRCWLYE